MSRRVVRMIIKENKLLIPQKIIKFQMAKYFFNLKTKLA